MTAPDSPNTLPGDSGVRLLPAYHDDCAECCGPVRYKTRFEVVRDILAYDLFMALPMRIAFGPVGMAILPYAGGHAFTCDCPAKVFK